MKEKSLRGILVGTIVLVLLITLIGTKSINNTYAIDTNEITDNEMINIPDERAPIGEKVYVDLNVEYSNSQNIKAIFTDLGNEDRFEVYLKYNTNNETNKYFFIVPESATINTRYMLKSLLLYNKDNNGTEIYNSDNDNDRMNKNIFIYVQQSREVTETLDKLVVEKMYLEDSLVYTNENVNVHLDYTGAVDFVTVQLWGEHGSVYETKILDFNGQHPYFKIDGIEPGKYTVHSVGLCLASYGCSTYANNNSDSSHFGDLTILEKQNNLKLVAINLNTLNAEPGDKVYVDVNANKDISSALLVFYDSYNKKTFSAYVKNIKGHGYFMLPSTVESGGYRLQNVIIKDTDGNTQVTNVPDFVAPSYTDDNGVFYETIEMFVQEKTEENKDSLVFNNEEYDDLINKKIESLSDTGVITVICDNAPLVRSTLFKKIAETRKTLILQYGDSEWVFNGTDIVDPKYIDVSMLISSIKNSSEFGNSNISNLISEEDTSVLSFANNGTLPGKALIRLNSTELDSKFGNKDIFVYYYNTEENKLFKIALEVQKIEGYYEFYINHNSDYVLSTKELEGDYVVEDKELLNLNSTIDIKVSDVFSSTKATIIALVCVVLIAVIAVVSLLHIVKHGKYVEKKDNKVNKKGKK